MHTVLKKLLNIHCFPAHYNDVQQLKDYSRCIISLPNPGQDEALRRALQLPFVVINGGPQSGKSSIAAALACMFVQRNKQSGGGQVLLCAPNITSLHNIAGKVFHYCLNFCSLTS